MTMNTPRLQEAVPNSAGTDLPKLEAPPGACDCHMHIYDAARFPPARPASRMQANATVDDYRRLQKRIGTGRTVLCSRPRTARTIALRSKLSRGSAMPSGVAVVHPRSRTRN
jgi:predicted TIM-barrel fold metal-dependent hydrolase